MPKSTLMSGHSASGSEASFLKRWGQCAWQGDVSPMAFQCRTGSLDNLSSEQDVAVDRTFGPTSKQHTAQQNGSSKVFRKGTATQEAASLWELPKRGVGVLGRNRALQQQHLAQRAVKFALEDSHSILSAKESRSCGGMSLVATAGQHFVDDSQAPSEKCSLDGRCSFEAVQGPRFYPSLQKIQCEQVAGSAETEAIKIVIQICTSGWDSAMEMGIEEEIPYPGSSVHNTMDLNIEPKKISTKYQCHMLSDSACGLDLQSCDSLGEDTTAHWVAEQQGAVKSLEDISLIAIDPCLQSRVDQMFCGKSEYGLENGRWCRVSTDEEGRSCKEGWAEAIEEAEAEQSDKENGNWSWTGGEFGGQIRAETGKTRKKSWASVAGVLKRARKSIHQQSQAELLQEEYAGVELSTELVEVRTTSKHDVLPSDGVLNETRRLSKNLSFAQSRCYSVPTTSTPGAFAKPQGCQLGIFDESEVLGRVTDLPEYLYNTNTGLETDIFSSFSVSKREQSKEGSQGFGSRRFSLASTSLWSWFSQTTQARLPYGLTRNPSSRQGRVAARRIESAHRLSIERSSSASLNHPWIKIVIGSPVCDKAKRRPSKELAEDINLWIQNGLDAVRETGYKSPHRLPGILGLKRGGLNTFLSRLPHKGPFGCLACHHSLDSNGLGLEANRVKLQFSYDDWPADALGSAENSESTIGQSFQGLLCWENMKRINGSWKLDREQSDRMDSFCHFMELGWLQRKAAKTVRHLKVKVDTEMFCWTHKVLGFCTISAKLPLSGAPVEQPRLDGRTGSIRSSLGVRAEGVVIMSTWPEPVGGMCEDLFQPSVDGQKLIRTMSLFRESGQRCVVRWVYLRSKRSCAYQ